MADPLRPPFGTGSEAALGVAHHEDRRVAEPRAFAEVSLAIATAPRLDHALVAITEAARTIIGAHQALTSLSKDPGRDQDVQAVSLSDEYARRRSHVAQAAPDGSGIDGEARRHDHPVRLTGEELEAHPARRGFGRHADEHPPSRGWLAAPLKARDGRDLGLIQLSDKIEGEFTEADEAAVSQIAQLASVAIERAQAEVGLRESEERFRSFAETTSDVLWIADAAGPRLEYLSPAFEAVWGVPREPIMQDLALWAERLHPDDRERTMAGMPALLRGERAVKEYRIVRPDGALRWIRDTGFPIRDGDGTIRRLAGIAQDITEERRASEAVQALDRRFRVLIEQIPQLVWRARADGRWAWVSPQWERYTGLSEDASRDLGWLDALHPEDRDRTMQAVREAEDQGRLEIEHRLRQSSDQSYRWFQTRATPLRNQSGQISEWFGTATDIHDLRRLRDQQQLLVGELQHRTRNLLGVVSTVASQTVAASQSLDEFGRRFGSRLGALSRVQALLARGSETAVKVGDLMMTELMAHAADADPRVTIGGPPVELPGRSVQILALAIHELATNALKHGALRTASGRLSVTWQLDSFQGRPARLLVLDWRECGVAMPIEPRGGYGRELIEQALPYELDAATSLEFAPDGVRCRIELPLWGQGGRTG